MDDTISMDSEEMANILNTTGSRSATTKNPDGTTRRSGSMVHTRDQRMKTPNRDSNARTFHNRYTSPAIRGGALMAPHATVEVGGQPWC